MKKVPTTFSVVARGYYRSRERADMRLEVQKHLGEPLFHVRILRASGWSKDEPDPEENAIVLEVADGQALAQWFSDIAKWEDYLDSPDFTLEGE